MTDNTKRCMSCMQLIDSENTICPNCGYNTLSVQHSPYLPKGTLLMGRYTVGKVIAVSKDKASYMCFDSENNKVLKIHEFLPQALIIREPDEESVTVRVAHEKLYYDLMNSFQRLWSKLLQIDLPAFDRVYDVFFLNNTVYAVCEYTDCITLKEYFATREKLLSYSKATITFKPVMNVLSAFHRLGIIHGDLSPTSVFVGTDGKIRLSALNIPEAHGLISEVSESPVIGYAPIERCKEPFSLSPATDIYSLMALMYTTFTGFVPPPAAARLSEDTLMLPAVIEKSMSPDAVKVFFEAMAVNPAERIDSIDKLIISLLSSRKTEAAAEYEEIPKSPQSKQETEAAKKEEKRENTESSRTSVIFLKSFITAAVVIVIVFVTLYSTMLYDYMKIPALDSVLSSFSFLPINIDKNETTEPEPIYDVTDDITEETKTAVVADFKTLRYQDIKQNAVFNNSFNIVYEFQYSDEYEKNQVISQSIPFGQSVPVGTTITIVISKGVESKVLKDVIGMNFEDAKAVLEDDGFIVKKKLLENDGAQTPDEVFIMSLVAGLEFEKGTEITLSVWDEVKITEAETKENSKVDKDKDSNSKSE